MKISDIDKNLKISDAQVPDSAVWMDIKSAPFKLFGVFYEEATGRYMRLPSSVAEAVSPGVAALASCTSGGRVKFKTNSPFIAIKAIMENAAPMSHMTLAGQSGFDLYGKTATSPDTFRRTFIPPANITSGYSSLYEVAGKYYDDYMPYKNEMTEYTVNFPLYDGVKELYIALDCNAVIEEPEAYKYEKSVVYYGSSITQGGCASRPGNSYQSIISRKLSTDYVNLGFSGSARGEAKIAEYIAELDMSVFVCDYDHNSPNANHLEKTLSEMYKIIRKAKPETPYIFISAPDVLMYPEVYIPRRESVREIYLKAKNSGDKNVYFIDGATLFEGDFWDSCTVDGCHPNDLGFYRMADNISQTIKELL